MESSRFTSEIMDYQEEADIMVKSKLGSGTEFILVIPRKDPGIIVV